MGSPKPRNYILPRVISLSKLLSGEYKVAVEKTAVTMPELQRDTSAFSKKYVPGCNGRELRQESKRARWLFRVKCSKPDSKPSGHIVRLKVLRGKGRKVVERDVLVSCSCPAWSYWGADYNAYHNGYSEAVRAKIHLDQGIRDPGRTYLICKHVYVVGDLVKSWAVPYAFAGEKQYRYKERAKPVEEEIEEVEPGVPEVRRPQRPQKPQRYELEDISAPEEEETPEEEDERYPEEFPDYLL